MFCDNNRIKRIPVELCTLTNITKLTFSRNQISKIPAEILKLVNLSLLDLDHNYITELPLELSQLPHLEYLFVMHNRLNNVTHDESNNIDEMKIYLEERRAKLYGHSNAIGIRKKPNIHVDTNTDRHNTSSHSLHSLHSSSTHSLHSTHSKHSMNSAKKYSPQRNSLSNIRSPP